MTEQKQEASPSLLDFDPLHSLQQTAPKSEAPESSKNSELGRDTPVLIKIQESKPFYTEPYFFGALSTLISVIALVTTIYNAWSTKNKDTAARRQSINDEFWLRKVLFPTAIEPILHFFAETLRTLPKDRFDSSATAQDVSAFKSQFEAKHYELSTKFTAVGILKLKQSLYQGLVETFEKVQDEVVDYCFGNKDGYDPNSQGIEKPRIDTVNRLTQLQLEMLEKIKQAQEEIS